MNKFEKLGAFYLGRLRDEAKAPLLYDSKDLTTHGLVVGMTGSGKTGLSVVLLEKRPSTESPLSSSTPRAIWET